MFACSGVSLCVKKYRNHYNVCTASSVVLPQAAEGVYYLSVKMKNLALHYILAIQSKLHYNGEEGKRGETQHERTEGKKKRRKPDISGD